MGTRSTISIANRDGSFTSAYCHWDGYPSWNGRILNKHYRTVRKINQLVGTGDMSSLKPHVVPVGPHSFDAPEEDVTVFYGRDRGEEHVGCVQHACEESLVNHFIESWTEYAYKYESPAKGKKRVWWVMGKYNFGGDDFNAFEGMKWHRLTDVLKKED